jgi:sortase (surface protein transpeptidase)
MFPTIMLMFSVFTGLSLNINLAPVLIEKQALNIDQSLTKEFVYIDDSTKTIKISSPKPPEIKPVVLEVKPINKAPALQTETKNTPEVPKPETKEESINGYTLTISKIGLNKVYFAPATMRNMPNLESQMHYSPVWESGLSVEPCSDAGNSYLMGHSEPASGGQVLPGDNIFTSLNLLAPGDLIKIQTPTTKCSYQVTGWDKIVTGPNDSVSKEEFNRALYPASNGGMLSIQTCQKGSTTVRLILRAEKVA